MRGRRDRTAQYVRGLLHTAPYYPPVGFADSPLCKRGPSDAVVEYLHTIYILCGILLLYEIRCVGERRASNARPYRTAMGAVEDRRAGRRPLREVRWRTDRRNGRLPFPTGEEELFEA